MALRKTLKLMSDLGVEVSVSDAYIKINRVDCDKNCGTATVHICREKDGRVIRVEHYPFAVGLDGPNYHKQAYLHLKTLPEFADAEDC